MSLRSRRGPFAMPTIGILIPARSNTRRAVFTCARPPSMSTRSGIGQSVRAKRRSRTSFNMPTSSGWKTVRILNLRYSSLSGPPSANTTMEPTADVPEMFEMS